MPYVDMTLWSDCRHANVGSRCAYHIPLEASALSVPFQRAIPGPLCVGRAESTALTLFYYQPNAAERAGQQDIYIMPVYRITVKRGVSSSAVKLEPGMNVEIVTSISTPLTHTASVNQIIDAFIDKYGSHYPMDRGYLRSVVNTSYMTSEKL